MPPHLPRAVSSLFPAGDGIDSAINHLGRVPCVEELGDLNSDEEEQTSTG